jgi:colicin import membrane protein
MIYAMLLRASLVVLLVLAIELPVAAQTPAPAAGEPAQVDRPASKRLKKRAHKGEKRARRARRAADAALVVRNAPAHNPADGDDVPPPETTAPLVVGTPGEYKGVRPGKVALPPNPPKATGQPYLTWSGFMMTDHGSRVFLQFTQPVQYTVHDGAREVVVTVKGARIHKRNNGRMVNTRYFATPVAKVQAKQHGKDVRVTILLRKPAKPEARLEAGEQGFQFLMLDFPPTGEAPASQMVE